MTPWRDELRARALPVVVVRERGDEQRAAGELEHLDGRDRAAAGRLVPELGHVQDLARPRQARDDGEVDPLDVPDDGDARPHDLIAGHGADHAGPGRTLSVDGSSARAAGAEFTCGAASEDGCWCAEVVVAPERLAVLREHFLRCLCPDCLRVAARTAA